MNGQPKREIWMLRGLKDHGWLTECSYRAQPQGPLITWGYIQKLCKKKAVHIVIDFKWPEWDTKKIQKEEKLTKWRHTKLPKTGTKQYKNIHNDQKETQNMTQIIKHKYDNIKLLSQSGATFSPHLCPGIHFFIICPWQDHVCCAAHLCGV